MHALQYNVCVSRSERGQLSLRPPRRTLERLLQRARLLDEKPTVLAERYLEEGMRMDEHPDIRFVDGPAGRRPKLLGGPDIWEVVMVAKDNGGSVGDTAAYLQLDPRLVHSALRYYGAHRDEIDEWIARNDEFNERAEAEWRAAQAALSA